MTQPPPLFDFFNEIGIIDQLARRVLESVLPDGLREAQFHVLNHLARLGDDRPPVELARAFQVTKGAMTNTLQRLEARGLIEIRPDPRDGRAKRVLLTEAGRNCRDACFASLAPVLAELEQSFARAEFDAVLPFLVRLRRHLDTRRNPS